MKHSSLHDCRHPGLVQSVLAPVMGITNINLQYSPGAKRIDVLARYSSHNKEGSKYSQKSKVNLDSWFQDTYVLGSKKGDSWTRGGPEVAINFGFL